MDERAKHVVWFKDGYYYVANTENQTVACYRNKGNAHELNEFIIERDGAEFWR